MATGPRNQYAHMAKLAVDFVRKRPNRACPRAPPSRLLPHLFPSERAPRSLPLTRIPRLPRRVVYELAKMQPHYGVGSKFARTRWEERGAPDSFWTVTKLNPKASGRAGKAWGTLTWKGEEKGVEQRIPKAMTKGIWKVIADETPRDGPELTLPPAPEASSEGDDDAAAPEGR